MKFIQHSLANPLSAEASLTRLDNGCCLKLLETGVLRVSPAQAGKQSIIISCGIHGNETAPIELVDQLLKEILVGDLVVENDLLFILGNPVAVNDESRFVEENLNRLFSGKHLESTSLEATRARQLEAYVEQFYGETDDGVLQRLHYDLHTSIRDSQFQKFAVYPFLHDREWSKPQLAFLEHCGVEAMLLSSQPAGTFSYFTSHNFTAEAFTLELGKARKFGDNNMPDFEDVAIGLRALISGKEEFTRETKKLKIFRVVEEVIKRSEEFKLHFPDDAKNFTEFAKGSLLATDGVYEYRTQLEGERFVFPIINVPIGQRAMLVVAPTEF